MAFSLSVRGALGAAGGLPRELLLLLVGLALGLLVAPMAIFFLGGRALGPYAGGGLHGLLTHFYGGLASGTLGFWIVALGPYVILMVLRGLLALLRPAPTQSR